MYARRSAHIFDDLPALRPAELKTADGRPAVTLAGSVKVGRPDGYAEADGTKVQVYAVAFLKADGKPDIMLASLIVPLTHKAAPK